MEKVCQISIIQNAYMEVTFREYGELNFPYIVLSFHLLVLEQLNETDYRIYQTNKGCISGVLLSHRAKRVYVGMAIFKDQQLKIPLTVNVPDSVHLCIDRFNMLSWYQLILTTAYAQTMWIEFLLLWQPHFCVLFNANFTEAYCSIV